MRPHVWPRLVVGPEGNRVPVLVHNVGSRPTSEHTAFSAEGADISASRVELGGPSCALVRGGSASLTAGMINTMGERLRRAATKSEGLVAPPATLKRSF
jgi:hypothetical protein